ncbi:uncharacterized protein IUM83_02795 [Phytophthora cinnamomi]|uniref:uncharacterized protein n=1 Tax=Phytophthora cinnamomi TaxID=4785 RepID=UPI003559B947|nr:hypothetical protein IUM83_02795 [Phytophthora cinnamomi]
MEESDRQLSFVATAKKKFTVALISSVVQFGAKLVGAIRLSLGEGLDFVELHCVLMLMLYASTVVELAQFVDEAVEAGVGADVEQLHELIFLGAVAKHGGMMVINGSLTEAYSEHSLVLAAVVYASAMVLSSSSVQAVASVLPKM